MPIVNYDTFSIIAMQSGNNGIKYNQKRLGSCGYRFIKIFDTIDKDDFNYKIRYLVIFH